MNASEFCAWPPNARSRADCHVHAAERGNVCERQIRETNPPSPCSLSCSSCSPLSSSASPFTTRYTRFVAYQIYHPLPARSPPAHILGLQDPILDLRESFFIKLGWLVCLAETTSRPRPLAHHQTSPSETRLYCLPRIQRTSPIYPPSGDSGNGQPSASSSIPSHSCCKCQTYSWR